MVARTIPTVSAVGNGVLEPVALLAMPLDEYIALSAAVLDVSKGFEDVENVEVKLVGFGNAVVVAVAVAVLVDVAVDVSFVLGGSAVKDCTISSAFPANGL